jgi:RNA polymerase sigma-70 factor (ECF subfamily)
VPAPTHSAAELYKQYGPVVYRRCLRFLKNQEAARDATQDVFVKLVREMPKIQDRQTVLPWVYRAATNHCLNLRRNAHRRGEDHLEADLDLAPSVSPDGYPDRALAQAILSRFDEDTQAIAVGAIVDGMEHGELAASLGVSRRTVARKLQQFLEGARQYVTASEREPGPESARSAAPSGKEGARP